MLSIPPNVGGKLSNKSAIRKGMLEGRCETHPERGNTMNYRRTYWEKSHVQQKAMGKKVSTDGS